MDFNSKLHIFANLKTMKILRFTVDRLQEVFFFLMRLGMPQAILLIMATPSCGF
jgi:hypothetical protein